jgi:protein-tyrosine phosphatase
MAATIFRYQLQRRGLTDAVRVSSAGSFAIAGNAADADAVKVLVRHGYPAPTSHRAAEVNEDHLSADLVLALGWDSLVPLVPRVDRARLTVIPVASPCGGDDFERAHFIIGKALPFLMRWVYERLAAMPVPSYSTPN